jgi:hypothetical protein
LMSDQELFDTVQLDNGGYGRYGRYYGTDRYGYRGGGLDFYPRSGSLARYNNYYGGYPDYYRGEI